MRKREIEGLGFCLRRAHWCCRTARDRCHHQAQTDPTCGKKNWILILSITC
jgi:hypothetical protein